MNISEINPLTLPSLLLSNRSQLPGIPAIYFALNGDCVLYIGRTINLTMRWAGHNQYNRLLKTSNNVRIAWLECSESSLLPEIEVALIQHFQPIFNLRNGNQISKRNDPDYMQITGDVKKDIGLRFKAACTLKEISIGEGLEEALKAWLEQNEQAKRKSNKT